MNPRMMSERGCIVRAVTFAAFLVLGVGLFGILSAAATPAASCFASDDGRNLSCSLGLELWEEGKKSERLFQLWHLTCEGAVRQTSCTLERIQIVIMGEPVANWVDIYRHSTSEGNLLLRWIDRAKWELSFDVIFGGGERMPVLIELVPSSSPASFLYVKSFQAKTVVRNVLAKGMVSQEWRIPDYSYTLSVPLALRGKKSADQKAGDDLMKRLSAADRQVFKAALDGCSDFEAWFKEGPMRAVLQEIERKVQAKVEKMTETERGLWGPDELAAQLMAKELYGREDVQTFLRDKTRQCLMKAGMSKAGAELASSFMLDWTRKLSGRSQNRPQTECGAV